MSKEMAAVFRRAQTILRVPAFEEGRQGCCSAIADAGGSGAEHFLFFSELFQEEKNRDEYWWAGSLFDDATWATQGPRIIALELAALIAEEQ